MLYMRKRVHGSKNTRYEVWVEISNIFSCHREVKVMKKGKKQLSFSNLHCKNIFFSGTEVPIVISIDLEYVAIINNAQN